MVNKKIKAKKRINNRLLYSLISLGIIVVMIAGVYGSINTATEAYHSADKIDFTGVEINPAKIVTNNLCIGTDCKTAWPSTVAGGTEVCPEGYISVNGKLCYKFFDHSNSDYQTWYSTRVPGSLYMHAGDSSDYFNYENGNIFCREAEDNHLCTFNEYSYITKYYACPSTDMKVWTSTVTGVNRALALKCGSGGFFNQYDSSLTDYTITAVNTIACCN